MTGLMGFGDELGPGRILRVYQPDLGLEGVVVVDNVARGPAIGGMRMAPDVTVEECFRLARAMTLKSAAAELPHGGAKSVLRGDPKMAPELKESWIRSFASAMRDLRDYIPGPDMGTDEACMARIKDEIGRAIGLPRAAGGIPLDEIGATGRGLLHATLEALPFCGLSLSGARVVIQGFGAVGKHAARLLAEKGAVLVGVADSGGTVHNGRGLDVEKLIALKEEGRSVTEFGEAERMSLEAVVGIECDIWIPAARPDVLREDNVRRLKAKLVVQGANIPATAEAEKILHEGGVLSIPDFIANAGGLICGAVEYQGGTEISAMKAIEEKISRNIRLILEDARRRKIQPRQAALDLAASRVREAMTYRRWGVY